jgi:hypothetical protein
VRAWEAWCPPGGIMAFLFYSREWDGEGGGLGAPSRLRVHKKSSLSFNVVDG